MKPPADAKDSNQFRAWYQSVLLECDKNYVLDSGQGRPAIWAQGPRGDKWIPASLFRDDGSGSQGILDLLIKAALWGLLLLAFVAGAAQSQPPDPTPFEANKKEQANTNKLKQQPNTKQGDTQTTAPLIVVLHPQRCDCTTADESKQSQNESPPNGWSIVFTGILAIAAITGNVLARRSVQNTGRSAAAAERSAEIAERSFVASQSAVVIFNGWRIIPRMSNGETQEYFLEVGWGNFANGFATEVKIWIAVQMIPVSNDQELSFFCNPPQISLVKLGPGAPTISVRQQISLRTIIDAWHNQTDIFVWTGVKYRDSLNPEIPKQKQSILNVVRDPRKVSPFEYRTCFHFRDCDETNTASQDSKKS